MKILEILLIQLNAIIKVFGSLIIFIQAILSIFITYKKTFWKKDPNLKMP